MEHSKQYKIFQNMLNEYTKVDLNASCEAECNKLFGYLAQTLCDMNIRNPLTFGTTGYSEYEDMLFFYEKWNKKNKTCAFRMRFLMAAYDLCNVVTENIFDRGPMVIEVESLDELKEKEFAEAEKEDIESETYQPVEEPNKVFGVLDNPVYQLKKNKGYVTNYDGESNEVTFPEGM